MGRRRDLEAAFLEASINRADVHESELERLRIANSEEYHSMKISLEKEIQVTRRERRRKGMCI